MENLIESISEHGAISIYSLLSTVDVSNSDDTVLLLKEAIKVIIETYDEERGVGSNEIIMD